jgi:hypothetical protein
MAFSLPWLTRLFTAPGVPLAFTACLEFLVSLRLAPLRLFHDPALSLRLLLEGSALRLLLAKHLIADRTVIRCAAPFFRPDTYGLPAFLTLPLHERLSLTVLALLQLLLLLSLAGRDLR